MRYPLFAGVFLTLCLAFAFAGVAPAFADNKKQDDKKEGEKKDDKKDGKREGEKKADPPLTAKEFEDLMNDIQRAWNGLKIHHRNRRAEQAAQQADRIVELAEKGLRYDGEVLKGDNKGKKARDQADYKEWNEDMRKGAEDFARYARAGDWDKAATARERINNSCGNCHDVYEP
jgi:hypothetical protein